MALQRAQPFEFVPSGEERLTVRERLRVGAEIFATYCLVRWWLVRLSFPAAVAAARNVKRPARARPEQELTPAALRLAQLVERTLHPLPIDARCLVRALVLTRVLARRGIGCSFILGVRAQPEFAAHAWLERGGVALLPTDPAFHRIAEM